MHLSGVQYKKPKMLGRQSIFMMLLARQVTTFVTNLQVHPFLGWNWPVWRKIGNLVIQFWNSTHYINIKKKKRASTSHKHSYIYPVIANWRMKNKNEWKKGINHRFRRKINFFILSPKSKCGFWNLQTHICILTVLKPHGCMLAISPLMKSSSEKHKLHWL